MDEEKKCLRAHDEFIWLKEQIEDELPDIEPTESVVEVNLLNSMEPIANQPIEAPIIKSNKNEIGIVKNPIEYAKEPLEDPEPILDQIKPFKLGLLEPIEEMFPLREIFTEGFEYPFVDMEGVEVY